MLDRNISIDDINFAIKNSYKNDIECVFNDLNDDNLVFQIRLSKSSYLVRKNHSIRSDEIYKLKNFQAKYLNNIILKRY